MSDFESESKRLQRKTEYERQQRTQTAKCLSECQERLKRVSEQCTQRLKERQDTHDRDLGELKSQYEIIQKRNLELEQDISSIQKKSNSLEKQIKVRENKEDEWVPFFLLICALS